MGFGSFLKKAVSAPFGGTKVIGTITGSSGRKAARRGFDRAKRESIAEVRPGFQRARSLVKQAGADAKNELRPGYKQARSEIKQGSATAQGTTRSGFGRAISRGEQGVSKAQSRYESPELVQTRAELLSRVMGKGGFSDNTVNAMKANAREEFGTGLRSAEQTLNSYYGESGAGGLAGENLALAASTLGGQRGRAIRDIDIQNAQLQEAQQTGAISSLEAEAGNRAGIDMEGGRLISGLEEGQTRALAALQTQEAFTMAGLSVEEASNLAQIAAQVGLDLASLSTEEATILANVIQGHASNVAATRDTTNYLATGVNAAIQGFAQGAGKAAVAGG